MSASTVPLVVFSVGVFSACQAGTPAGGPPGSCSERSPSPAATRASPPNAAKLRARTTPSVWDVVDDPQAYAGRRIELEGVLLIDEQTQFLLHDLPEARLFFRRMSEEHYIPRGGPLLAVSAGNSQVSGQFRIANGREVRLVGEIINLSPDRLGSDLAMNVTEVHF